MAQTNANNNVSIYFSSAEMAPVINELTSPVAHKEISVFSCLLT